MLTARRCNAARPIYIERKDRNPMSTKRKYPLTAPPSTAVSRRFIIGGLAAIPAAAAPGRALSTPQTQDIGLNLSHALASLPAAERACAAWAVFTAAMDELAADHSGGWTIFGAGHRRAHEGSQRIEEARWLYVRGLSFVDEPEPRLPRGFITVERHHPINLPPFTSERLEEIAP
jgi:hypothetical protein